MTGRSRPSAPLRIRWHASAISLRAGLRQDSRLRRHKWCGSRWGCTPEDFIQAGSCERLLLGQIRDRGCMGWCHKQLALRARLGGRSRGSIKGRVAGATSAAAVSPSPARSARKPQIGFGGPDAPSSGRALLGTSLYRLLPGWVYVIWGLARRPGAPRSTSRPFAAAAAPDVKPGIWAVGRELERAFRPGVRLF